MSTGFYSDDLSQADIAFVAVVETFITDVAFKRVAGVQTQYLGARVGVYAALGAELGAYLGAGVDNLGHMGAGSDIAVQAVAVDADAHAAARSNRSEIETGVDACFLADLCAYFGDADIDTQSYGSVVNITDFDDAQVETMEMTVRFFAMRRLGFCFSGLRGTVGFLAESCAGGRRLIVVAVVAAYLISFTLIEMFGHD